MTQASNRSPIIAAGGVVYQLTPDGQIEILLIKKRGGFWSLAKGRVKRGETRAAAAVREVMEETGVRVHLKARIHQVTYVVTTRKRQRQKVVTYYLMEAVGGSLHPEIQEAILKVRWFRLEKALRRLRRKRLRLVVKRASYVLAASGLWRFCPTP